MSLHCIDVYPIFWDKKTPITKNRRRLFIFKEKRDENWNTVMGLRICRPGPKLFVYLQRDLMSHLGLIP